MTVQKLVQMKIEENQTKKPFNSKFEENYRFFLLDSR